MSSRRLRNLLLIVLGAMGASLTLALTTPAQEKKAADGPAAKADDWKLVFSDEFDKPGLVDPEKWSYEEGYLRNREKQYYTGERKENVRVEDGKLIIEARKDNFEYAKGKIAPITSGSLFTKKSWTYGKIEVRAKIPTGRGTWPAIWMMAASWPQTPGRAAARWTSWRTSAINPETIYTTMHTQKYNHMRNSQKGGQIKIAKPWENFHVYCHRMVSRPDRFLPGRQEVLHLQKREQEGPRHLAVRRAGTSQAQYRLRWRLGRTEKGIDDSIFPQRMEITYVRIYQQKKAGE